jgi:hypothetical protein
VNGGQQAAARADVVVERDAVGQARDRDAGLEIDRLGPAAEQPVGRRIGDAVDAPGQTSRRRSMDGARAASSAGPVHVEEDSAIAFLQRRAVETVQRTADGLEQSR